MRSIFTISIYFLILFCSLAVKAQKFEWARSFDFQNGLVQPYSIVCDKAGNSYFTGIFGHTSLDFDPGADTSFEASDGIDIFLFKFDPSGTLLWSKQLGGGGWQENPSIRIDDSCNLFLAAQFFDSASFDGPAGQINLKSAGNRDLVLAKLDSSGQVKWAKGFGRSDYDARSGFTLDRQGNIYLLGGDYFFNIKKFDNNGNQIWSINFPNPGNPVITGIGSLETDSSGNLYFGTQVVKTVDADPGPGTLWFNEANGQHMLCKINSAGQLIWAKQLEHHGFSYNMQVCQDGSIYSFGSMSVAVDYDPGAGVHIMTPPSGEWLPFVTKLKPDGTFCWVKTMDFFPEDAIATTIDKQGNIFLMGVSGSGVDHDPGPTTHFLPDWGSYILKLDSGAQMIWAKKIHDYGSKHTLNVDEWDNVYASSLYNGTTDLDPGEDSFMMTPKTTFSIAYLKLSHCDVKRGSFSDSGCHGYTWRDQDYDSSGLYSQTFTSADGCDSIVTLNLVNLENFNTIQASACHELTLNGITYNNSGVYIQTLTNSMGCDSTLTIQATVIKIPIGITNNGTSISADFQDSLTSYQWINCSTMLPVQGETNRIFIPDSSGNYAVIISKLGCSDTSACIGFNTGIGETALPVVSIFPNPANELINIKLAGSFGPVHVKVLNMAGQVMMEESGMTSDIVLDIGSLANGMYLVQLNADDRYARIKVVKE